ncbi:hypothetical protein ACN26Z_03705 [Verrucosispora sp. WMMD703]|uniref:Flavin reductase n=1 Tax=Micromonospora sediminimaris TaxID=547162 RepID=A0A9W5XL21_9ACTN|nr:MULTISPECIES: hypothetical protein [Micromonospora]WFE45434.1 hypothetical protein O7624_14280 [Verrucosispora sp. WMMD1129]GIJ33303.1 hypothetical protein Vse01_24510 [Micromonospora sediminimaris]SFC78908.1 hypothetical protein SAMN05216284_107166 [Micromonospora sediminimaris]
MTSQIHVALRPLWLCRACAAPWPCANARLTLLAEYRDSHVALSIYLAGLLYDAVEDLYRLDPHNAPKPAALHERFLGWAAPRAPRPHPTD